MTPLLALIAAACLVADEPTKISLRRIDERNDVEVGTEGVIYWGGGVSGDALSKNSSTFTVLQVIDDDNLLVNFFGKPWWLEMPTKGIADDTRIDLSGKIFSFAGTKRYESALGTKTVFHFKFIEDIPAQDKDEPAKPPNRFRKWNDKTGSYSVEAEFVDFKDGRVVLKKRDGTILKVHPASLSDTDVKWYRDELKRRKS